MELRILGLPRRDGQAGLEEEFVQAHWGLVLYLGIALQSTVLGRLLPKEGTAEAADPAGWSERPLVIIPAAPVGSLLGTRLWNARPK